MTRLTLHEFRCYERVRLQPDPRPVVLVGPNGAGKTNLLEALSFLAPGRGLRRARLAEVGRNGAADPAWAVAATVATPHGPVEIGTGRDPQAGTQGRERRLVRIDGAAGHSQGALAAHLAVVWLTPPMDRLFADTPGTRRRFLDRLVYSFDAEHAPRTTRYEHAMRERARLLADGVRQPAWLDALEGRMAETGVAIAAARRELALRLDHACTEGVGPFPRAAIALDGAVEDWLAAVPALAAEDRLRAALADNRATDAAAGATTLGPHRSDLVVRFGREATPAAACSTGEQKALLLSIVLAHARLLTAERGAPPLLLLDEVAAHLDPERRAALYDELCALGGQAWLSGTEAALFAALGDRAQVYRVDSGRISPAAPDADRSRAGA